MAQFLPSRAPASKATRLERFAINKFLIGWTPVDVLDYLIGMGVPAGEARNATNRAYNRVTNPLLKGRTDPTNDDSPQFYDNFVFKKRKR